MACNSCKGNNSLEAKNLKWEPLSGEQIQKIVSTIDGFKSLAAQCTGTSKTVGDVVHLSAQPTGGTAPYTVVFKKDSVQIGNTVTGVAEAQAVNYDYTTVSGDISVNAHIITVTSTDSCTGTGGPKTCTESCNVTVSAVACPVPILTMSTLPGSVTQGTSTAVTLTLTTTGTGPYTYEIFGDNTSIISSGAITASTWSPSGGITWGTVGTHALYGKVTDSCATGAKAPTTATQTVEVVATCGVPTCNLIVT